MKKNIQYFSSVCILFLLCITFGQARLAQAETPPFGMEELTKLVEENAGKVIMLNFFASWCPPCKKEVPDLIALRDYFSKDEVIFIGVSLDEDPLALAAFMGNLSVNYPVYLGKLDLSQHFNVSAIPHNVVYDTKGRIVISFAGAVPKKVIQNSIESLLKEKKL